MSNGSDRTCGKCGGLLEAGSTTAQGLLAADLSVSKRISRLVFIVLGTETSQNPIKAFKQGIADERADRHYRIAGYRCSQCGALELYAEDLI
jgi:hypothetical protein